MFTKYLSIIVIIAFLSAQFSACSVDSLSGVNRSENNQQEHELYTIKIDNVGEMHNAILHSFNERHQFLKSGKLHVEEFIRIFIESAIARHIKVFPWIPQYYHSRIGSNKYALEPFL